MSDNTSPAERNAKDYAIEHAGYLATAARRYLDAINAEYVAQMEHEENESDVTEITLDAAIEDTGEANRALRNAIHEFEKRRDRALAAQAAPAPLTDAQRQGLRNALESGSAYVYQQDKGCMVRDVRDTYIELMANAIRAALAAPVAQAATLGDLYFFQTEIDRKDALLRQARALLRHGGQVTHAVADKFIAAIDAELAAPGVPPQPTSGVQPVDGLRRLTRDEADSAWFDATEEACAALNVVRSIESKFCEINSLPAPPIPGASGVNPSDEPKENDRG